MRSDYTRSKLSMEVACAVPFLLYMLWLGLAVLISVFLVIAPFVHEARFTQRLLVSSLFSLALIPFIACANGGWAGLRRFGLTHGIGGLAGLALFTWMAAEFSPNVLWLASQVLPSVQMEQRVTVVEATHAGASYRRVNITYVDPSDRKPRYLTLSRRAFAYRPMAQGDVITLLGRTGPLGTCVTEVIQ